jgi:TorA maturation chaperone TorD
MSTEQKNDIRLLNADLYRLLANCFDFPSAARLRDIHEISGALAAARYPDKEIQSLLTALNGSMDESRILNDYSLIFIKGGVPLNESHTLQKFSSVSDVHAFYHAFGFTCSASAMNETHLCYLPRDIIFLHMKTNPELAMKLVQLMAQNLRVAAEKLLTMAVKPAKGRVAESILILKEVYGYEDDEATINTNLKREEIASIAGTVRETATRFLAELNNDKIILLDGRKIKILNMDKLIRCANL